MPSSLFLGASVSFTAGQECELVSLAPGRSSRCSCRNAAPRPPGNGSACDRREGSPAPPSRALPGEGRPTASPQQPRRGSGSSWGSPCLQGADRLCSSRTRPPDGAALLWTGHSHQAQDAPGESGGAQSPRPGSPGTQAAGGLTCWYCALTRAAASRSSLNSRGRWGK